MNCCRAKKVLPVAQSARMMLAPLVVVPYGTSRQRLPESRERMRNLYGTAHRERKGISYGCCNVCTPSYLDLGPNCVGMS